MNTVEISSFARHLFESQGPQAIAQAAQKAVSFEDSGDQEQARTWRQIESVLLEIRGPVES